MNLKKLFKSTGIYFLGNTLSKVISLVLVPLYTKYLNPTDYGTYDIIITYLNIGILIIFLDIGGATLRFIYEQTDYKKVIDNSLCIFIISSTIYTIGFWLISLIVNIDNAFIVFLYGLLSAIVQYMSYIARGLSKSRLFALSGVIGTLFTGLFNVIFIKVLNYGYASLFLSYIIASIIKILILELNMKLFKNFKLININISLIKKIFAFALPLSINYIGEWFLSSYNKVAVTNILGLHQNGLYAITNKFSMILTFVSTSFFYAWQEMAFSIKGSNMEKGVIFGKAIRNYIKVLTPISIGLIAFIWFAFPYVVDEKYYQTINYIPLSILAITISVLNGFLGSIFGSIMLTKHVFTSTMAGAIVNVLLCHLLIRPYGVNGASFSLTLGFSISVLIRILLLKKYINLKISYLYFIIPLCSFIIYSIFYNKINLCGNLLVLFLNIGIFCIMFKNEIYSFFRGVLWAKK